MVVYLDFEDGSSVELEDVRGFLPTSRDIPNSYMVVKPVGFDQYDEVVSFHISA